MVSCFKILPANSTLFFLLAPKWINKGSWELCVKLTKTTAVQTPATMGCARMGSPATPASAILVTRGWSAASRSTSVRVNPVRTEAPAKTVWMNTSVDAQLAPLASTCLLNNQSCQAQENHLAIVLIVDEHITSHHIDMLFFDELVFSSLFGKGAVSILLQAC